MTCTLMENSFRSASDSWGPEPVSSWAEGNPPESVLLPANLLPTFFHGLGT